MTCYFQLPRSRDSYLWNIRLRNLQLSCRPAKQICRAFLKRVILFSFIKVCIRVIKYFSAIEYSVWLVLFPFYTFTGLPHSKANPAKFHMVADVDFFSEGVVVDWLEDWPGEILALDDEIILFLEWNALIYVILVLVVDNWKFVVWVWVLGGKVVLSDIVHWADI